MADDKADGEIDGTRDRNIENENAGVNLEVFRFMELPRELRDQIYSHTLILHTARDRHSQRIERRHLRYFHPSAAAILLILHSTHLLLNHQVSHEVLEVLFKQHTVFLSCGPFVLRALLERIERGEGQGAKGMGRQWLAWMKEIELDWMTFPNLALYPPVRTEGSSDWYWEGKEERVGGEEGSWDGGEDGACVRYEGHRDEYDHEGNHYDDNMYDPSDTSLYPSFHQSSAAQVYDPDDEFGYFVGYDPYDSPPRERTYNAPADKTANKFDLLMSMEVTPLFRYLASPTFNITSITLPLYFLSKPSQDNRNLMRPGSSLPLKSRYWIHVCIHTMLMLIFPRRVSPLQKVRVKYLPWDIWASMNPTDDLNRMVERGVWFDDPEDAQGSYREGEGEAFRAVWTGLMASSIGVQRGKERSRLHADVQLVPWDGNVDSCRVGDELEVVFTRVEK